MDIERIGYKVIGSAIEAHKSLGGCGLLESLYEDALCYELEVAGLQYERQKQLPIYYKTVTLATPLKIDLVVEGKIIVECKATQQYNSVYEAQLLTYLRLSNLRLGYVFNFGQSTLRDQGIHRVVNNYNA